MGEKSYEQTVHGPLAYILKVGLDTKNALKEILKEVTQSAIFLLKSGVPSAQSSSGAAQQLNALVGYDRARHTLMYYMSQLGSSQS